MDMNRNHHRRHSIPWTWLALAFCLYFWLRVVFLALP